MHSLRRAAALFLCLLLVRLPVARAASVPSLNPHLTAAQSAADDGDLDRASAELERALAAPDNTDDTLVEIYKLQGIVALSRDNTSAARRALEKLFQTRPDYELPKGTSPKIRALFTAVQTDVRQHRVAPVTLQFEPVLHLAAGGPARISATVADLPEGARVRIFYRRAATDSFETVEFTRGDQGGLTATLPAAALPLSSAPFILEYYLEIDDAAGRRLAGRGDAFSPLVANVEAPSTSEPTPIADAPPTATTDDRAWYDHWYIWVGAGVVAAAAAGVGVYYATRPTTGTLPVTVSVNNP